MRIDGDHADMTIKCHIWSWTGWRGREKILCFAVKDNSWTVSKMWMRFVDYRALSILIS